jgi:hypothetical protein
MTSRSSMTNGGDMVSPMAHYVSTSGSGSGSDVLSSATGGLVPSNSGEWVSQMSLMTVNSPPTDRWVAPACCGVLC